jgi:hypothetical protein
LLYLKQLSIEWPVDGVSSDILLRTLRQNGSLQDVAFGRVFRSYQHVFNQRQSRLAQSYCERNELIPTLVAKPRLDDDDRDKTDLCLFPNLFTAAKQAPRTAPNLMLIGLLAALDSIGPKSGGK